MAGMKDVSSRTAQEAAWGVGWCCSYCSAPLEPRDHGLVCPLEDRWFATDRGVHRLLPQERRQEMLPALELDTRVQRDLRRSDSPRSSRRATGLDEGLRLASPWLPAPPWRVLDVGAGSCWASLRLMQQGHSAVAVDVSLDPEEGLPAASDAPLPRAEAEMDALPLEPGLFDLVLCVASLHYAPRLRSTLIELRRVTRRGGLMLALGSPVFRRREDGEAVVARRMRELGHRYGFPVDREVLPGYLVLGEMQDLFRTSGWLLEVRGWPRRAAEWVEDGLQRLRGRRPEGRGPILLARRDG